MMTRRIFVNRCKSHGWETHISQVEKRLVAVVAIAGEFIIPPKWKTYLIRGDNRMDRIEHDNHKVSHERVVHFEPDYEAYWKKCIKYAKENGLVGLENSGFDSEGEPQPYQPRIYSTYGRLRGSW